MNDATNCHDHECPTCGAPADHLCAETDENAGCYPCDGREAFTVCRHCGKDDDLTGGRCYSCHPIPRVQDWASQRLGTVTALELKGSGYWPTADSVHVLWDDGTETWLCAGWLRGI